MLYRISS